MDDASPDNSWEILQKLARNNPRVKLIRFSRNFGQHPAIAAALDHRTGEQIVLMDTDLQDRPEDIPRLLRELKPEVHVVYSRKSNPECESFFTRWTSRLYHRVISKAISCAIPKDIGTFRAFSSQFASAISRYREHGVLFGPLMFHAGFPSTVVEVERDPRLRGKSSYSFSKRLNLAVNSLVSYTDLPHKCLMKVGMATLAGSAIYAVLVLVFYLLGRGALLPGLNLIVLLLTLLLGTTMLSLGVIGTYVFRIYQEVLARPRYLIERTENLLDCTGSH